MRLNKKEKQVLFNEILMDSYCHLQGIMEDDIDDFEEQDKKEFIETYEILKKAMRQIRKDLDDEGLWLMNDEIDKDLK